MDQYYRVQIKMSFEDKKGNQKYRKESYLVFAISPTDVEAKLSKFLGVEDYEIVGINTTNFVDIVK